jgi:hypothetical protein
MTEISCQWQADCPEPVVAKIGLPTDKAIWVCLKHFNEWRESKQPKEQND